MPLGKHCCNKPLMVSFVVKHLVALVTGHGSVQRHGQARDCPDDGITDVSH